MQPNTCTTHPSSTHQWRKFKLWKMRYYQSLTKPNCQWWWSQRRSLAMDCFSSNFWWIPFLWWLHFDTNLGMILLTTSFIIVSFFNDRLFIPKHFQELNVLMTTSRNKLCMIKQSVYEAIFLHISRFTYSNQTKVIRQNFHNLFHVYLAHYP